MNVPASADQPVRIIHTALDDGTAVCIREIRLEDEQLMRDGIARMSRRSLYLRFFTGLRTPSDRVIERLLEVDGRHHLAWGAIDEDELDKPAVGAVHAYREDDEEECAEFSVAVIDDYHGRGLAKLLTATILLQAREEGVTDFRAFTLAENQSAIDFVKSLGAKLAKQEGATLEFHLPVSNAVQILRRHCDPPGIADVFSAFDVES